LSQQRHQLQRQLEAAQRQQQEALRQQYAALKQQLEAAQKQQQQILDRIKQLIDGSEEDLRAALTSEQAEERFAGAYAVGERELRWTKELIERLDDEHPAVRQAARRSLMILSYLALHGKDKEPEPAAAAAPGKPAKPAAVKRPVDFGPAPLAGKTARATAIQKWTDWWAERASPGGDDKGTGDK
jgi:hypothetical protein